MTLSFYSQNWYRVAPLKLRLRQHVDLHRHVYRGEPWYVLQDRISGQLHRFDADTYQIIGLMDGERSLQTVWDIACERLGDNMPTQDEIIELVAKLHRANAIQGDLLPNVDELVQRGRDLRRKKILQQLKSPLGIRIPLVDPERFLSATLPFARPLLGRGAAFIWITVVFTAGVLALMHWDQLTNNVSDQVLSVENLIALWFVYPVVKLIHELGHGYAVKRWGGEVHEMGVMLLVFVPVPYVEASAASVLENKYQRAFIGAAGIAVEVLIASFALIFWVLAEPGAARAVAFNVMLIAGVSTVLFNGNPLLRFDAYYVLCDLLESPNLGTRGNRYVGYLAKRFLFGVKDATAPYAARGEAPWLTVYAIASYIYRLFIMAAIVLFVATQYFVLGVMLAIWSALNVFFMPLFQTVRKAIQDPQLRQRPKTFAVVAAALTGAVVLFTAVLPLPMTTFAEGVVWAEQDARLYSPTGGFIEEVLVTSGTWVAPGRALIRCSDPRLEADIRVLEASLREARARVQAEVDDRTEREVIESEVDYLERELANLEQRRDQLTFRSPRSGRLVLMRERDLPGSWIARGQLLGHVVANDELRVNVPLSQDSVDLVRADTTRVEARFASKPAVTFSADIEQQVPSASRELPSPILTTDGGGRIARDPQAGDRVEALENYFQIQLNVPDAEKAWLDERVYVLFHHGAEALMHRWYRGIRRLFLKRFDL